MKIGTNVTHENGDKGMFIGLSGDKSHYRVFDYVGRKEVSWSPKFVKVDEDSIPQPVTAVLNLAPAKLGFWKVAFAVLLGNMMTGVIGALLYGLSRL